MGRLRSVVAMGVAVWVAIGPATANRDLEAKPSTGPHRELLVFEAANCLYCNVFRKDVLPDYLRSRRAEDVPIRFIDIEGPELEHVPLSEPLSLLPTVVLIQEGHEAGRITGYTGPQAFFQMMRRMLGPLD